MSPINFVFLVVGLIVGLMAFIGFMNAVKGTPVRAVAEFGDGQPAAVDQPGFRTALELVSRATLHAGHDVEIFFDSSSFTRGALLSLAGLLVVIVLFIWRLIIRTNVQA